MKFQKYLWLVSFLVFLVFQCSDVKAKESPNNAMFNDLLINNEVQKNHSYCSNQYIKAVNHLSYINSERVEEINGNLFYFDINGNMKTDAGWISYKGKRYYADTGGKLFRDQTISFGSKEIYYMSNDGSVFSGVKELNGSLFYFDSKSNGKLVNTAGWILFDGKQYYADTGGKLFRNQTISFGSDIIYYMSSDGSVFSGIKELNGEMVYFDLANEGK